MSSSPHTSIESSSKACSVIIALFYISTLLSPSWLLFIFSPFVLYPWEIHLRLRAICHLLQTFPFCNSPATLTSTRVWAEVKKGLNVSEACPIRQQNYIKSRYGFTGAKIYSDYTSLWLSYISFQAKVMFICTLRVVPTLEIVSPTHWKAQENYLERLLFTRKLPLLDPTFPQMESY